MNENIIKAELTILFGQELTKKEIVKTLESVNRYAVLNEVDNQGVKRLAYPIEDRSLARYICIDLAMDKRDMPEVGDMLENDSNVMRYLLMSIHSEGRDKVLTDWKMN